MLDSWVKFTLLQEEIINYRIVSIPPALIEGSTFQASMATLPQF
jgi:hypothetical protein